MADKPASERTEQATPERLRKAREEGQVPQSEEVPSVLIISAVLMALVLWGPELLQYFTLNLQQGLTHVHRRNVDLAGMSNMLSEAGGSAMLKTLPLFVVICVASVLGSLVTSGWSYSTKALEVDWQKISPVAGMKNLISWKSFVHLLVSMAKVVVIGSLVYTYLKSQMDSMLALQWGSTQGLIWTTSQLIVGAAGRIALGLAVIAGADMVYQKWRYKRQMMMTRQEIKEERKEQELPGEVKGKMRSIAMTMARKRAVKAVPTADVVIVNPTHVAVALKYDHARMDAPKVVAKGADFPCQTIKDIARKHNVPIIERPELARALYASCKEGQTISEDLFVAVAEVLAIVYRLRRRRLN